MICYHFFFAKIVGWFGEYWVMKALRELPSDKYTILNDIMLDSNGYTHQIDHIIQKNKLNYFKKVLDIFLNLLYYVIVVNLTRR